MESKVIFFICASAVLVQLTFGQCFGRMGASPAVTSRTGLGFERFGPEGLTMDSIWAKRAGCNNIVPAPELAASYGGGLSTTSSSDAAPTGLAVSSDNIYEGPVAVTGNLPFLGTAVMEGVFPTAGTSSISYGCGDGAVAITAEGLVDAANVPATIASNTLTPASAAAGSMSRGMPSWGFKSLASRGCGFGNPSFNI